MTARFLPILLLIGHAFAADAPKARIITKPGPEYSDVSRTWEGIPGIERTAKGRLWITWYSGDTAEGGMDNYGLAATSANDGKTWGSPALVYQGPKGTRIGDPLPWIDPKGRLWIFYSQHTADKNVQSGTFAIRTDNPDSASPKWSEPRLIGEAGILFGKPLVRSSGWIAPFFINGRPQWIDKTGGNETGTLISRDEGESWQWLGGTTIAKDLRNFGEATLAERKDGSLAMFIRTQKGLYQSDSKDGGEHWTDAVPMPGFDGPVTRAHVRRLASGAWLMVYHDAVKNAKGTYGRERLTAWLSDDEGRSWPNKLVVDERNRVSYPDSVQSADGRIFITYDHGRYEAGEKELLVSILREEDIRAGKIVSKDARLKLTVNRALGYGNGPELELEKKTAQSLPPKEKLHLYLLIGQSNMAGRGPLDTEKRLSRLQVLKFSQRNAWTAGVEPLHFDKPGVVGAGIGMSFARAMAGVDKGVTIGLIPCAVGGTPLERWSRGGDLYQQALERARAAMKDGTLKGILWHQGENDAEAESTARSYAGRLAKMVNDLRTDLGAGEVPFVAGKLGEFLSHQTKEGKPDFWPVVNEQLASLPALVPHTAVVDSSGLSHKGDQVHFDTPSLRVLGNRYADAMKNLQAK